MVASQITPHPLEITSVGATTGTVYRVYNRTTGDSENVKFGASSPTVYDLANLGVYTTDDVIEITVVGINEGGSTYTVSGGKGKVTVTVSTGAAPGVSI